MANTNKNTPQQRQGKNSDFVAQEWRVFKAFAKQPMTMMMASKLAKVERANICRFVADWQRRDRIFLLYKSRCPITKHPRVGFYTTNIDLVKQLVNQTKLF